MSAANLALIAASLLTAITVFPGSGDKDDGLVLLSARDAVVQDVWPVSSGTVVMPHVGTHVVLQNGFRGAAPSQSPLYICITAESLNVDLLESWVAALNTTAAYQLYLVVGSDPTQDVKKLSLVRRLTSMLKSTLAAYIEVQLRDGSLPGFLSASDERLLIQRDVCMRLIRRRQVPDDAFLVAVDLTHASGSAFTTMHLQQQQRAYSIRVGDSPFAVTRNVLSGQPVYFAVPNEVEIRQGVIGAQVVFDLATSWQLERLRVGPSVIAGYLTGMAGHLMWLWSRSKQDLFQMTLTANKTYALAARALVSAHKLEDDLHTIIRTLNFNVDQREEYPSYPLVLGRCATYELAVLEAGVTVSSTDDSGQKQRRKGSIGRVEFKQKESLDACMMAASSGLPLQLCQPQTTPVYRMRSPYGEEPKAQLYRQVIPLLASKGHCIAGGRVPLRHRRTYGSYSDYGVYPKGFDGYDMFSLMEGTVEGDTQAARLLAPSVHNPKDLHDEDKVRVMPTLVPVRLKKAK
jgi:hypothetical protein